MDRRLRIHRSSRASWLDRDAAEVWSAVAAAGPGEHWYVDAAPLVFRGALDRVLGGQGRRWTPPDRELLRAGDTAGFWRVLRASRRTLELELEADVRAPGRVLLSTRVVTIAEGGCRIEQSVAFDPGGLLGQLYMLVDLPAREAVIELVHRRLLAEVEQV